MLGNVFSPYYAAARRRHGGVAEAEDFCALNVALYGIGPQGPRKRWAMTERPRRALSRSAGRLAIGPSSLAWEGETLVVRIDERTVPLPGRIRGTVRVHAPHLCAEAFSIDAAGRHRWCPLAACARVSVDVENPARRWQGAGYLDTNAGLAPLERDFRGWHWSRAATDSGAVVLYDATTRDGHHTQLALALDAVGGTRAIAPPPVQTLPGTLWRIARQTRAEAPPRLLGTMEDTPFYARSVLESRLQGASVRAFHESLDLDRFASRWVQALLPFRMPRQVF